jgi:hypothetical protein
VSCCCYYRANSLKGYFLQPTWQRQRAHEEAELATNQTAASFGGEELIIPVNRQPLVCSHDLLFSEDARHLLPHVLTSLHGFPDFINTACADDAQLYIFQQQRYGKQTWFILACFSTSESSMAKLHS